MLLSTYQKAFRGQEIQHCIQKWYFVRFFIFVDVILSEETASEEDVDWKE